MQDVGGVQLSLSSKIQKYHQRYYVSWRGRCLLFAAPNLRRAALDESDPQVIKRELSQLQEPEDGHDKEFEDLSEARKPKDPQEEVRRNMEAHQKKDET